MKLWVCENHICELQSEELYCRVLHRYRRGQGFESRASLFFFFFSDLLFATAKVAYITAMIFIHIIQIIIVNTQALWFHDMFYDQNRLLLAHAFNILSPISCFLNWWPCSHLLLHYTYLHFTWLRYVFYRQVRKFNSEVPLLKKSKLTQLDCLSHFILKGIQYSQAMNFGEVTWYMQVFFFLPMWSERNQWSILNWNHWHIS